MNLNRISLFHFTSRDVAELLVSGGDFVGDEKGLVYFAEHPQHVDGAMDKSALCQVDFESLELDQFRKRVKYESVDEDTDLGDEYAPEYDYFLIPDNIVNRAKRKVRYVGGEERRSLMT